MPPEHAFWNVFYTSASLETTLNDLRLCRTGGRCGGCSHLPFVDLTWRRMDGDYLLRSALFGMLNFVAVVEISRGGNGVLFGFRDALRGLFPTIP